MLNKPYTYGELLEKLNSLHPSRLQDTVTVYDEDSGEYKPVVATATAEEKTNDVLDDGHFYLAI